MREWSSGKDFSISYLLFGLNCGGSPLQQFYLKLKRKNWLKSIIFISSSSMREWFSGKEFRLSYLLFGFISGGSLLQQFYILNSREKIG